jgi:hypothetical protein
LKGGGKKHSLIFDSDMAGCQGREVKVLRCPAAVKGTKARKTNATVVGNTIMGRRVSRKPKAGRPIQNTSFTNF